MALLPRFSARSWQPWTLSDVDDWLSRLLVGGGTSKAGASVSEDTALTLSGVYACVRVLSGTIASLPFIVLRRRPEGGKERAPDHHLYPLLHDRASDEMTAFEYRETTMVHLLLWGNAYTFKVHDRLGRVAALYPIHPARVAVARPVPGEPLEYRVRISDGTERVYGPRNIMHLRLMSTDGMVGRSVISLAREDCGLALAEREFGARWFGEGAHPSGIIEHEATLSPEARREFKEEVRRKYAGLGKSHGLMVLEKGLKFHPVTVPPEDSQFLESRKFSLSEICRWFRVPAHLVNDLDRATNNNVEELNRDFVRYVVREHCVRLEQAVLHSLFPEADRASYFAEFNLDGILRGDPKARAEVFAIMWEHGALTSNEWRGKENLNPLGSAADTTFLPLNMAPADRVASGEALADKDVKGPGDVNRSRAREAFRVLLEAEARRVLRREEQDVCAAVKRFAADPVALEARVEAIAADIRRFAAENVGRVARAAARALGVRPEPDILALLESQATLQKGGVIALLATPDPLAALDRHYEARRCSWPAELADSILNALDYVEVR